MNWYEELFNPDYDRVTAQPLHERNASSGFHQVGVADAREAKFWTWLVDRRHAIELAKRGYQVWASS
jgi:hypothetical protein